MLRHLAVRSEVQSHCCFCRVSTADAKVQRDVRKVLERLVRRVESKHRASGAMLVMLMPLHSWCCLSLVWPEVCHPLIMEFLHQTDLISRSGPGAIYHMVLRAARDLQL